MMNMDSYFGGAEMQAMARLVYIAQVRAINFPPRLPSPHFATVALRVQYLEFMESPRCITVALRTMCDAVQCRRRPWREPRQLRGQPLAVQLMQPPPT